MDARIDVFRVLALTPGDAHVVRNAGGRVTDDVIRSLALSQHYLGTEEIMVVHHTDCALGKHSDEEVVAALTQIAGEAPGFPVLAFADDRDALVEDVQLLRQSPFLRHRDRIRGFLYDVARWRLEEVR